MERSPSMTDELKDKARVLFRLFDIDGDNLWNGREMRLFLRFTKCLPPPLASPKGSFHSVCISLFLCICISQAGSICLYNPWSTSLSLYRYLISLLTCLSTSFSGGLHLKWKSRFGGEWRRGEGVLRWRVGGWLICELWSSAWLSITAANVA